MTAKTRLMADLYKIQRAVIEAEHRAKVTEYLLVGMQVTAGEGTDIEALERTKLAVDKARIHLDDALATLSNEVSNLVLDEAN